jgi:hypothetical protein
VSDAQTSYVGDLVEMCGRLEVDAETIDDAWEFPEGMLGDDAIWTCSGRRVAGNAWEIYDTAAAMRCMGSVLRRMLNRTTVNPPAPWEIKP